MIPKGDPYKCDGEGVELTVGMGGEQLARGRDERACNVRSSSVAQASADVRGVKSNLTRTRP